MHTRNNPYIFFALLGAMIVFTSFGNEACARGGGGRRQGPPPEAYTACEGKSAGDKAEFVSPRGDTVTGVCKQNGDRLFLVPDNPPPDRREKNDNNE